MSGSARYFNIELNENDVQLSDLSEYQRLAEQNVLSGTMMLYVDWLKQKYLSDETEFSKMLSEKFLQYRSEFIEELSTAKIKFHNRTPDMLSHLKIGMKFLLTFLCDYEQLTEQEFRSHTKSFDMILLQNCSLNAEIIVNENPTTRFCEKLKSLIDSGRCYVETRGLEAQPRQKNCIGLQDSEHYYLFADAAHSEVRKLCSEQGEHFTISKNELLRQLRSEGLLLSRTNRNTISIRDNSGTVVNVAMLDKKKIEQRMSGDLCPPSTDVG